MPIMEVPTVIEDDYLDGEVCSPSVPGIPQVELL